MAPLALVANLWHNLDWFKIWSSGGAICIVCKGLSVTDGRTSGPKDPLISDFLHISYVENFDSEELFTLIEKLMADPDLPFRFWVWDDYVDYGHGSSISVKDLFFAISFRTLTSHQETLFQRKVSRLHIPSVHWRAPPMTWVPWKSVVRSMGVRLPVMVLRLNWCDFGRWSYQLNTNGNDANRAILGNPGKMWE